VLAARENGAVRFEGVATGWTRREVRFWLTGLGALVSLAIVGPTFWWEETWHGAPLIDRGGLWWLLPSVVMASGFFLGGTLAGYPRRRVRKALWQGVVASTATIVVIFAADLYRRHSHGESLPVLVGVYWIAALGVAGGVSGLGALYGRARAIALRRSRST
jgi:hypothetical protein